MKLLIVDDERIIRTIFSSMVQEWDYEVMLAADGEQAWELIESVDEPLIVLLDWIMPGIDGVEMCKRIKQSKNASRTHVIMLTVKSGMEDMVAGFEAGADDFLVKPVDHRELGSRLSVGKRILQYQYDLEQRNLELMATKKVMEKIMGELQQANEKLKALSTQDGLTGLSNRRNFEEYLEREWQYAQRQREPLTLIMLDVDFFKLYNDTYGHWLGDECLKLVAKVLTDSVKRSGDLVARYGGEEFAVVARNTDSYGSQLLAEKIRLGAVSLEVPHELSKVAPYVTVSLGVATMVPEPNTSYRSLIETADKALYQAKYEGRNRWVVGSLRDSKGACLPE